MYKAELCHHGILGQKWGKHNGPPYPLGSDISTGSRLKKTFVSGSSKTQDSNSEYYKKKLPYGVRRELKSKMKSGNTILVGDAPGIDRQVQDFLKKKGYKNVEVYSPGKKSRYLADKNWKNKLIDDPKHEPGSPEWLAKKDKAMTKDADEGIAVVLPNGGAKATRNNIARLQSQNKPVSVYELKMNNPNFKKKVVIGAAIAGTALAVAGGAYLYKSGKLNGIINAGKMQLAKTKNLPTNVKGLCNPGNYKDNCKDVSTAVVKRWTGADVSAVAGPKSFKGNLHEFVSAQKWNPKGIHWLGLEGSVSPDPNGDSAGRVTRRLLKSFNEGDCGIISMDWDPKFLPSGSAESGHAFNWYIAGGKVKFIDDQPLITVTDAEKYFKMVNINKEIEIVKITKEAFA